MIAATTAVFKSAYVPAQVLNFNDFFMMPLVVLVIVTYEVYLLYGNQNGQPQAPRRHQSHVANAHAQRRRLQSQLVSSARAEDTLDTTAVLEAIDSPHLNPRGSTSLLVARTREIWRQKLENVIVARIACCHGQIRVCNRTQPHSSSTVYSWFLPSLSVTKGLQTNARHFFRIMPLIPLSRSHEHGSQEHPCNPVSAGLRPGWKDHGGHQWRGWWARISGRCSTAPRLPEGQQKYRLRARDYGDGASLKPVRQVCNNVQLMIDLTIF